MKAFSFKTLFAAGAMALGLAAVLPASAAMADVSVGIGIYPPVVAQWSGSSGSYGGYDGYSGAGGWDDNYDAYDNGSRGYEGQGSHYRPRYPGYDGYVSCRDGRRILWRSGYHGIEVQSCRHGYYRYTAWRNGRHYLVAVDAQGDVMRLRRIY